MRRLKSWVEEVARLTRPDSIHWCTGSDAENSRLIEAMLASGDLIKLNPTTHPNCYLHRSHPSDVARVEHLTFVCTRNTRRRRPEQSLDGSGRSASQDRCAVRRRDARPHDVRDPVLHGPDRFALFALRRRDHGQPLRRRQHAHHDAHGRGRAAAHRARRHVREGPALDRRSGSRTPLHHALPRGADRSRASARATAATRCSARSATRCASPAGRRATKAGSPSTC